MDKLRGMLRVLLTPSCWTQCYRYSKAWDRWLNDAMASSKFERVDHWTAEINGQKVWIENHPYGSFNPWLWWGSQPVRPRRITILRAMDKYEEDTGWGGV